MLDGEEPLRVGWGREWGPITQTIFGGRIGYLFGDAAPEADGADGSEVPEALGAAPEPRGAAPEAASARSSER